MAMGSLQVKLLYAMQFYDTIITLRLNFLRTVRILMQQMKMGRLLCIMLHVQVSYISLQEGKLVSSPSKNFPLLLIS